MNKDEALEQINKQSSWHRDRVKDIIKNITLSRSKPDKPKIGDVFKYYELNHMCVVMKVKKNQIYASIITSKPHSSNIGEFKSRFLPEYSYISSTLLLLPNSIVKERFLFSLENNRLITESKQKLKQILLKL